MSWFRMSTDSAAEMLHQLNSMKEELERERSARLTAEAQAEAARQEIYRLSELLAQTNLAHQKSMDHMVEQFRSLNDRLMEALHPAAMVPQKSEQIDHHPIPRRVPRHLADHRDFMNQLYKMGTVGPALVNTSEVIKTTPEVQ